MCICTHLDVFTGTVTFLLSSLLYKSFRWINKCTCQLIRALRTHIVNRNDDREFPCKRVSTRLFARRLDRIEACLHIELVKYEITTEANEPKTY